MDKSKKKKKKRTNIGRKPKKTQKGDLEPNSQDIADIGEIGHGLDLPNSQNIADIGEICHGSELPHPQKMLEKCTIFQGADLPKCNKGTKRKRSTSTLGRKYKKSSQQNITHTDDLRENKQDSHILQESKKIYSTNSQNITEIGEICHGSDLPVSQESDLTKGQKGIKRKRSTSTIGRMYKKSSQNPVLSPKEIITPKYISDIEKNTHALRYTRYNESKEGKARTKTYVKSVKGATKRKEVQQRFSIL